MKYEKIKIYAHPLSGGEEVLELIKNNFQIEEISINKQMIFKEAEKELKEESMGIIYIQNLYVHVIKDIYDRRTEFGIKEEIDFKEFNKTHYSKMTEEEHLFSTINHTPKEYYCYIEQFWLCKKGQRHIFNMMKFKDDPETEMLKLAIYLGSDKDEFNLNDS